MTLKLKAYMRKLGTDAKERENFKKNPLKALKSAKLSDADAMRVISGALAGGIPNHPISHMVQVKIICSVQAEIKTPK